MAIMLLAYSASGAADGDPGRGKGLYAVCSTCHGEHAEGVQELNGPALTGLEDWYIVRQLQNFKTGVRGTDKRDIYGQQMAPMAQVLPDDQAMEDVAAYIKSLAK